MNWVFDLKVVEKKEQIRLQMLYQETCKSFRS